MIDFRHRLMQGEVHDENAYCDRRSFRPRRSVQHFAGFGGVLPDAAEWRRICAQAHPEARDDCGIHRAAAAWRKNTRTLGWVVPTEGSSSGHYFSAHSYGHTGFTGTTIWIDPDRQVFVVLLTNRVNPTRENNKIAEVRPAVHDAVMKALGFAQPDHSSLVSDSENSGEEPCCL